MAVVTGVRDEPSAAWAALAPLLAGTKRVKISRDRGKSYPASCERDLSGALPSEPAAVKIFGPDGTCSSIFLDFDVAPAGVDWVEADVRAVTTWLHDHGARWIEDHSPAGGRHVYIPLAERVTFHDARLFVEALGARYRSLDKSQHQNLLQGCMRVPGSVHKAGGHQMLAMSLNMAYDILRRPNRPTVWQTLNASLTVELEAARALRENTAALVPTKEMAAVPELQSQADSTGMSRPMVSIAVNGLYDTARYRSPSEARQAVLTSAARSGMELTDVQQRIYSGIWPGLAQFYSRYRPSARTKALRRDWSNALSYLRENQLPSAVNTHDRKIPTSLPPTHRGDLHGGNLLDDENEYRFILSWRNALRMAEGRYRGGRSGLVRRIVLRALGAAARQTGSRFIEFGVRSLAIATGQDHTTVAKHLRALRIEKDPLVTLVETGRGTHGDLYMLTIPASMEASARDVSWRGGKIHALRPAFRELGLPAAYVYESLEHSPGTTTALVDSTGLGRTSVSEALEVLAAWNLASRTTDGTWQVNAGTCLQLLAERLGVLDLVCRQIARYRTERALWRQWLAGRRTEAVMPSPDENYPWELFEPLYAAPPFLERTGSGSGP